PNSICTSQKPGFESARLANRPAFKKSNRAKPLRPLQRTTRRVHGENSGTFCRARRGYASALPVIRTALSRNSIAFFTLTRTVAASVRKPLDADAYEIIKCRIRNHCVAGQKWLYFILG